MQRFSNATAHLENGDTTRSKKRVHLQIHFMTIYPTAHYSFVVNSTLVLEIIRFDNRARLRGAIPPGLFHEFPSTLVWSEKGQLPRLFRDSRKKTVPTKLIN